MAEAELAKLSLGVDGAIIGLLLIGSLLDGRCDRPQPESLV